MDTKKYSPPIEGISAAAYDYVDENNTLIFQIVRFEPKDFRSRQPDGQGGWRWGLDAVRLILYRLPDVIKASDVLILEGEKDVETAYRLGLPGYFAATSSPMGAGQWRSSYSELLRGKRVVICPDNDIPGKYHMKQIIRDLSGKAVEIRIMNIPATAKDISEWEQAGGGGEEFATLIHSAERIQE